MELNDREMASKLLIYLRKCDFILLCNLFKVKIKSK